MTFVNDKETRHSSEDYLFKLFDDIIKWHATKQQAVTTFSMKAELLAVTQAVKKLYWWKQFFVSIQLNSDHEMTVDYDN